MPDFLVWASSPASHEADPQWWLLTGMLALWALVCWAAKKEEVMFPSFSLLQQYSAFLLGGVLVAQLWVHLAGPSLHATLEAVFFTLPGGIDVTPHFLVNDVFMVAFFGIAAKELSEAFLKPGGDLRGKKGIVPIVACLGGVAGPALLFVALADSSRVDAWAVPCATDIAFAWLGARFIWGARHPAVRFLLALAVVDDFIGMILIAVFYPQHAFHLWSVGVIAGGIMVAYLIRRGAHTTPALRHWYVYAVPGVICWFGLLYAGLHSALALVLVVPFMPMEGRDDGIYDPGEAERHHDTINQFEHHTGWLVDAGLFFFGLANAGVAWIGASVWSQSSTAVLLGLGIGKPVGILVFTALGYVLFVRRGPLAQSEETGETMVWRDVPIVGILAGVGFTVALFVVDAAGGYNDLRIGALASFALLALGIVLGRLVRAAPVPPALEQDPA